LRPTRPPRSVPGPPRPRAPRPQPPARRGALLPRDHGRPPPGTARRCRMAAMTGPSEPSADPTDERPPGRTGGGAVDPVLERRETIRRLVKIATRLGYGLF